MAKTEVIHSRVDSDTKAQVEAILKRLGLKTSEAIALFFNQIILNKGIPFEVKIPNEETRAALKESENPDNLPTYTLDEFKALLKNL